MLDSQIQQYLRRKKLLEDRLFSIRKYETNDSQYGGYFGRR